MTASNGTFNGNDYRKRVLAAIETRGGIQTSDPFEWYDIAIEDAESIKDRVVTEQIAAVWAFWQKQRDHPKYRGLVTALLAVHHEAAAELGELDSRRRLAVEARITREERDESRFAELDGAIARLVERFGGIPRSKLAGLRAFAQQTAGVDPRSVESRLNRHRIVDDEPEPSRPAAATVISPAVYRQVRADLDELGRILGTPPPVSLYDLLGLEPGTSPEILSRERDLAAAHNRELRPDRRRALVDDLLSAITTLLLENDPEAYLDALAEEVTVRLRSRVAAAVLVEDELTVDDHGHLLSEAQALGLDHARAVRVLAALAGELEVAVPRVRSPHRNGRTSTSVPTPGPTSTSTGSASTRSGSAGSASSSGSARAWHETLSQARAALRAGRVLEAQRLVGQARQLAGGLMPPIRAVGDEVDAVLAEAHQRWRAALQSLAALRFTEAEHTLERLVKIAADVPGPAGETAADALTQARKGTEAAAAALAAAESLTGHRRELALLEALRTAADHPGLLAALETVGVQPAKNVRVRVSGGFVLVSWARSGSPGTIDYRIEHVDAAGARRAFGTTQGTELEAALPPGAGPLSRYAVIARRAGIRSAEALSATSDGTMPPSGPPPAPPNATSRPANATSRPASATPPPVTSLALLPHGRRIRLVYPAPAQGRAEVRRLPTGANLPTPGSVIADLASCGELVPGMGPGLAVDAKPQSPTAYVVLSIGPSDQVAVAGASTWYAALPPVSGLRQDGGKLRWEWPTGCTEVAVTWRTDAPPERADDPAATGRKVTNTRYQIDDGFALPAERPLYVAVFTCIRLAGTLVTASEAPDSARLSQP